MYSCCDWPGAAKSRSTTPSTRGPSTRRGAALPGLRLVAGRQPHQRPGAVPERTPGGDLPEPRRSASHQRQPSTDPALVPAQEIGDLDLGHAVLTTRAYDPGFFPLLGASAGVVEPVDRGLGQRSSASSSRARRVFRPSVRAAARRLKPSRTSYVSSRRQTTRGETVHSGGTIRPWQSRHRCR